MNSDIDISKIRKLDGGLLLILQTLLKNGSVTRTAEALSLSQSTISHALARLRELFEDPLFVRKPHGLEPTQRALRLEPKINALIDLAFDALDADKSFDPHTSTRTFTLSAPEFVTVTAATALLKQLEAAAPGVTVTFVHLPESEVFEQLRRGDVDVAVGRFDATAPTVVVASLYEDEFCIACRKGHRVSRGRLTPRKYAQQRHVWANSPSETTPRDAEFDYSGMRGSVVPRWLTALVVAAQSEYIATCPRRLAESQAHVLGLDVVQLPRSVPLPVAIAYRRDLRDKGMDWFIGEIRQVFR